MDKPGYIEAEDYYELGCQWRQEREWEKSITCFKHVIRLNGNFIYAYIDLAAVHAVRGEFHEAVSVLKRAVKSDPGFDLLHYNIAKYLFRCGDFPGALKYIDDAAKLNDSELYNRVRSVILKKAGI